MRLHKLHSKSISPPHLLGMIALSICSGCWEEIEYTGPDPSAATPRDSASAAIAGATAEEPSINSTDSTQTTISAPRNDNTTGRFAGEPSESTVRDRPAATETATITAPPDDRYETRGDGRYDQPDRGARTVSATVEVPPPAVPANTRRAAWLLGSKLSLAALAHDRGVAPSDVPKWFREARSAAESLQTTVPELPGRPAASDGAPASREVLGYLLEQGKRIGPELATHFGSDHAALFEVAMKSNLLLVLYKPGSSAAEHISAAIAGAAPRAGLPEELWRPLLDTLANSAPAVEVRAAVRRLHADAERLLATAVEP